MYFIALFTFHIVCSLLKYDDIGGKLILKQNVKVAIFQMSLFKCSECNSQFNKRGNLNVHVASVHEGKRPFECNLCVKKFTLKANLNIHIASVHEGRRPFECDKCKNRFSLKNGLKNILNQLTKERNHFNAIFAVMHIQ